MKVKGIEGNFEAINHFNSARFKFNVIKCQKDFSMIPPPKKNNKQKTITDLCYLQYLEYENGNLHSDEVMNGSDNGLKKRCGVIRDNPEAVARKS